MARSTFSYTTYIRTTPEQLWSALTDDSWIRQYWFGVKCSSAFATGAPWKLVYPDGRVTDTGEIAEATPPNRLVIRWRHVAQPELAAEGESHCTIDLQSSGSVVQLTLTHSIERDPSQFIAAISIAWPMVMSNLKSLLETGSVVLHQNFPVM